MKNEDLFNTNHLKQNIGNRAVRGGAVLVVGQAVQFLLSMASTIILARLLIPEDFGLLAMVLPFIGFLGFLRDSGLHMATVQQEKITQGQISTLFWFNSGLGFLLMVLLGLLSPAIALFFGRSELLWITLAYAINMLIGGVSIQHSALLKRQMAFKKLAAISILSQIAGLGVAIISAWMGLKYWSLVAMAITTTLTETVLTWSLCHWIPGKPQLGTGVRKMIGFGGGMTISNLFNLGAQYIDGILLGRLFGATPLGYYDRGKQLFLMPLTQLMAPLSNVAIPALSHLSDTPDRYAQAYLRAQEKLLIVTAAFSGLLVVFGDNIIYLLLGPHWEQTGIVLRAFAIGGIIVPVSSSVSWLLVTQGRSRDLACWSPFSLLFRCAAILCGYPWGIMGIAVSISFYQYLSFIVFSLWVGRKGPVTAIMVWKNMAPTLIAALVSIGIAFSVKMALSGYSLFLSFGIGATAFCALFLAVLWLIPVGKMALIDMYSLTKMALTKT
jgi:PST family polysaccharide transporter